MPPPPLALSTTSPLQLIACPRNSTGLPEALSGCRPIACNVRPILAGSLPGPQQTRLSNWQPEGEVVAGDGVAPQSMSHGRAPLAKESVVMDQRSSEPSGLRRDICPTPPGSAPSCLIVVRNISIVVPGFGCTAKATSLPCVRLSSSPNGRGSEGVGCDGSGAMISR